MRVMVRAAEVSYSMIGYRKQCFITYLLQIEYPKWSICYFLLFIHNIFTLTQRYGRVKSFTDRSQISKSEKIRNCSCSCVFVGAEVCLSGELLHVRDQNRKTWNVSSLP